MRSHVTALLLCVAAAGCDSPFSQDVENVEIRIANNSDHTFENVKVNGVDFGNVSSGEFSSYRVVEGAYRYGAVTLDIDGTRFGVMPIDYVGETPLSRGRYTYLLSVDVPTAQLELRFFAGSDMPRRRQQPGGSRIVGVERRYEVTASAAAADGGAVVAGTQRTLSEINPTISSVRDSRVIYIPEARVIGATSQAFMLGLSAAGQQQWLRLYGADDAWTKAIRSVVADPAGGYLLAGEHYWPHASAGWEGDAWLIRTTSSGQETWSVRAGAAGSEESALAVRPTHDGGYIIGGTSAGLAWLLRSDAAGTRVWDRTVSSVTAMNRIEHVFTTTDGGFVVVGDRYGMHKQDIGGNVIRTDAAGSVLWTTRFHGSAEAIAPAANGGFVVAGTQLDRSAQLVALDAAGNTQWTRRYVGGSSARDVAVAADGGFVLAGGGGFWLLKAAADGTQLWQRQLLPNTNADAHSVQPTADGGFLLVGHDQRKGYVARTNGAGELLWSRAIDGL